MRYAVEIRRNADGVVRSVNEECGDGADEWDRPHWCSREFWWSEGNGGCDCNRALFFARAAGEPEDWERGCGDTEYSVRMTLEDGRVVLDEFDVEEVAT